ncbi:Phenylalanine--tRNA ligase beta subunit [Candidatus Xenohaliotis californiensis]|uniref:Phenylalanine--tRNA ligase beta subunit n=1 Tax=Candidatus Xenohaliotis californiensis TaxID=84677 RepID=A0ABM9N8F2_9RICK|nr:Phenylalanine--tRNA ligase beta subunit [Candidatus Xenohaliotis californiensis]
MKFSFNILKKFLKTEASIEEVTSTLNVIGIEVESVHNLADELNNFTVASIVSLRKHPNADRLMLCELNDGSSEIRKVVCGASNLTNGMNVILAKPGTTIPNSDLTIKVSKIRGEQSNGMLCSAEELNLKGLFNDNGIIELPNNLAPGDRLVNACDLNDSTIEVAITPNRGDCASVFGIARDLATTNIGTLIQPKIKHVEMSLNRNIKIDEKLSPLICYAEINNINNSATPYWMKKELWLSDIKSITMPVDVTNYIRLIYGQPMHVYSSNAINGSINIGMLEKPLEFTALNEQIIKLTSSAMVIQDSSNMVLALAGIIGSKDSQYTQESSSITLEAAWFDPQMIAINGEKFNIHTDARYNFERSVDIEFTKNAISHAVELIITTCGGKLNQAIQFNQAKTKNQKPISYSQTKMMKFLGHEINHNTVNKIAKSLGFKLSDSTFIPPSWRQDITTEYGFFGEIIRIYGYNNIKPKPSLAYSNSTPTNDASRFIDTNIIRKILATRGMHEAITWSFNTSDENLQFTDHNNIELANPINIEMSVMRTTLLPNLLKAIKFNQNHNEHNASLFEIGNIYTEEKIVKEKLMLTAIRKGTAVEKNIHSKSRKYDALDIKADFLAITNNFLNTPITISITKNKGFSSSFAAKINEVKIGIFGKISSSIAKQYEINDDMYALILDINALIFTEKRKCTANISISKFPSIKRDFSFVLNENIKPYTVKKSIYESIKNHKLINSKIKLFDIYQNTEHKKNKKISISFQVILEPKFRTLVDSEIDKISNSIITNVINKHDATIRDGKQ